MRAVVAASGEIEFSGLHAGYEGNPLVLGERERLLRAVLRVAHEDGAVGKTADLDATAGAAEAADPELGHGEWTFPRGAWVPR